MTSRMLLCAAAAMGLHAASAMGDLIPIRITQVFGGGGSAGATYGRDYVELLNYGAGPIDLTGFTLQYAATTGSSWTSKALSGTIQPGSYFLVSLSTSLSPAGSLDLTPDFQTATSTAMANGAGKVALMHSLTTIGSVACPTADANLVDFVGYGTGTNCSLGAGPTGTISIITAAVRKTGGCTNTPDNGADFDVAAPSPKNSMAAGPGCAVPAGGDVAVAHLSTTTATGTCPFFAGAGQTITTVFSVKNWGPSATSDAVVVATIPAGQTYNSSTPSVAPVGNTVTWAVGALAVGDSATLTLVINAVGEAAATAISATASTTMVADPVLVNNTATGTATRILPAPVTTGLKAVYSSIAANTNSDVPAGVSAATKFFHNASTNQEGFGAPYLSPDGTKLAIRTRNTLGATLQDMVLVYDVVAGTGSIVVQQGVTDLGAGELVGAIDLPLAINNNGSVCFSTTTSAAAANNDVVVKRVGSTFTVVAREGTANGLGTTVGAVNTAFGIDAADKVLYGHGPSQLTEIVRDDGNVLVARGGATSPTTPTGQLGATTYPWQDFDPADLGLRHQVSPDGLHTLISGDLESPTTTDPDAIVYDGAVVLEDGQTVGSVPGTLTTIYNMHLNGADWMACGSNTGPTDDWVVRNGSVIAAVDQPLTPGNAFNWDDARLSQGFYTMAQNYVGDYVVFGGSNAPNVPADAVIVLNGKQVVVRENDPVDLNGDGMLNDDAYLQVVRDDRMALTNTRVLFFVAEIRSGASLCPAASGTKIADALLRVQLPKDVACCAPDNTCTFTLAAACLSPNAPLAEGTTCSPVNSCAPVVTQDRCCRGTTCVSVDSGTCTGTVGNSASLVVGSCGPHNQLARCCYADYDHSGTSTIDDLFIYINTWLVASPYTKIDGNTTAAPSIDDLFIFINLWLLGCTP